MFKSSGVVRRKGNVILGMADVGVARMQRDSSKLDTEMTKRARKRQLTVKIDKDHPHEWLKSTWPQWSRPASHGEFEVHVSQEYWYYTNDRSHNQGKAYIWYDDQLGAWKGKVRSMNSDILNYAGNLETIKEYIESLVKKCIADGFDFYAPEGSSNA